MINRLNRPSALAALGLSTALAFSGVGSAPVAQAAPLAGSASAAVAPAAEVSAATTGLAAKKKKRKRMSAHQHHIHHLNHVKNKRSKKRASRSSRRASMGGRSCMASHYNEPQMTASGERFNPRAMTAAHKTLPLGSRVRVSNPRTGRSVVVRINDRGPYVGGRCLDLSTAAFNRIGNAGAGVMHVRYSVL